MRSLLAAPDKFRGTATASQVVDAVAKVANRNGWTCDAAPMADGGEGTLEVIDGRRRALLVTGPLGQPVEATWVLHDTTAIIEMAQASGLMLAGGPEGNDPLAATTTGTGELIAEALRAGAERIIVGLGGSATTDGGLGCVRALWPNSRLREVELVAATDVQTLFVDAAPEFAPQKGATPSQVELLERRLRSVAEDYEREFGVDVRSIPGSGAAGGLGGGIAAMGGHVVSGFDYLADLVELDHRIEKVDIVVTGEGRFDLHSFNGKVVGGVVEIAKRYGKQVVVVAGDVDEEALEITPEYVTVISLIERFGRERAFGETLACVEEVIDAQLR